MNNKKIYIAYGSNISSEQMKGRCPSASFIGTGVLHDYQLEFRGQQFNSHATIHPCEGKEVPVALWGLTAEDEMSLDHYEGFPNYYVKEEFNVDMDGVNMPGMAYVMTPNHSFGVPSHPYLEIIAEGYQEHGFDMHALRDDALASAHKMVGGMWDESAESLDEDEEEYEDEDEDFEPEKEPIIKVMKVEPGKAPVIDQMDNNLDSMQEAVGGGLIECVYLEHDCVLVCNDEGKLRNMEANRRLGPDVITGPFFVAGDNHAGDFCSLNDSQLDYLHKMFDEVPEIAPDDPGLSPRMEFMCWG